VQCEYFGVCGSCRVYENSYDEQLSVKSEDIAAKFSPYYQGKIDIFASQQERYRYRCEFKIYHDDGIVSYAMSRMDKQGAVKINNCSIVSQPITNIMSPLLEEICEAKIEHKLFGIDFLSTQAGEVVVSLLYHRPLDEQWQETARCIANKLGIHIIGRSRKQKLVLSQDYVTETLRVSDRDYQYVHIENSFTQPNALVNEKMITWSLSQLDDIGGDLLELYCGAGNFTIPFASKFNRVLATEISKSSIVATKRNMELNKVDNIHFVRLSAEEFTQALDRTRVFKRINGENFGDYQLKTLFVDPPRSGLGDDPCAFAQRFDHLLYISCNPDTLLRDLELLCTTHIVESMAVFDQFPYTHHLEIGVKLTRKVLS
jgi:tRNA (uracil-5-)-methyltransferase